MNTHDADQDSPAPVPVAGRWWIVVSLGIAVWLLAIAWLWHDHGALLNIDEVDYLDAARLGALTNMVESGSLSPAAFVRFARSKASAATAAVPATYREDRDPLVLRHFHPPLPVLLLSSTASAERERVIRAPQMAGALALILSVMIAYGTVSGPRPWGLLAVCVLAFWLGVALFDSIHFHGWEAVWLTTTPALLVRWSKRPTGARALAAGASVGFALATLETGLFLAAIALLYVAGWCGRGPVANRRGVFAVSALAGVLGAAAVLLVLWPGALVKLSLAKAVGLYVYRMRLGAEYAGVGAAAGALALALLPLWTLGPVALIWLWRNDHGGRQDWLPFAVTAAVYAVLLVRFALNPVYVLPAMAPLACVIGVAADRLPGRWGWGFAGAALVAVSLGSSPNAAATDADRRADLEYLRQRLRGREALVEHGRIFAHYLGPSYSIRTVVPSYDRKSLNVREAGRYLALDATDAAGKVVVLRRLRLAASPPPVPCLAGCTAETRRTVVVYDCAGGRPADGTTRRDRGGP